MGNQISGSFVTGGVQETATDTYFNNFIGSTFEPLGWFALFIAATALVVLCGVQQGIERVSKVMMPILVVLTIFIAIYGLTLEGAMEGFVYYIKPHMSDVSVKTILAAMGQLFYSMSLAMGIMVTYGSYMKKDNNLESSVRQIEIFDTSIAFLAGLMIIPAVFAFSGGDRSMLSSGPGLMFMTLPKVFASMRLGGVIGATFFLMVLFAALTSAISLMETIVSIFRDKFHWERKTTCLFVTVLALLMGIPSSLGFGPLSFISWMGLSILDIMDFLSNSVLMPIQSILYLYLRRICNQTFYNCRRSKNYRWKIRWRKTVHSDDQMGCSDFLDSNSCKLRIKRTWYYQTLI